MLVLHCNVCRTKLSADPAQAGKLVRCPQCLTTLRVPIPQAAAEQAAPPVAARAPAELAGVGASESRSSAATATAARPRTHVGIPAAAAAFRAAGSGGKRYGFNC